MYDPTKPYKHKILELIRRTWETPYVSVENGVVKKKFDHREYHHTDGIGTKGVYHWKARSFDSAVKDALYMNMNDLAMVRAVPYAVTDHVLLPEEDEDAILRIVSSLTEECRRRNVAVTGGETAIHDNIDGLEISVTMLGFVKDPRPNELKKGNVLVGLESNGLHSNGFTKVREVFGDEWRPEFTEPTNLYLDTVLSLDERFEVCGRMHVTGGAFTKLKDILPKDADVVIRRDHRIQPHEIFFEIYERGVPDEEMYKTFNCGMGFLLCVEEEDAEDVVKWVEGFKADVVGEVVEGSGRVRVESAFSEREVVFS